ncbi:hypothetical protein GGTG_05936 [Gaeumannomyces tritici R3-111a-1]|uniref:NAD-dependent epimerase/dehydratase domain-containing protein n=1 Tax=Gaeumannomyces tritici (strain R3-111a-1) TaxID=644352 RepID=J3NXC9_GAET3|nr:hypothetical protein GGTG_05936 [Gaeumannomyces tritici R3-111a-1]EJT76011.1 hypothetical protein GGTG_05936 [Gaeumannomyces tritici R3-111a-1]
MISTSRSELVLITGATGHVGSATLLHLLRAGYMVRAAVRSQDKAAKILARARIQQALAANGSRVEASTGRSSQLTFVVVPDITAPGAYDEAARGTTLIIHIASPLVTGDEVPLARHNEYFIRPAVRGTLSMLEAAQRAGTVRRVVITSSIVSLVPVDRMEGTTAAENTTPVRPCDRVPFPDEPYTSEFAAYAASKVASLSRAEAWVARERPAFDVVYLHPSFVLGRNDAATTPAQAVRGTNAVVLAMLLGKRFGPYAGATVHVDDVAAAHVIALERDRVPGNRSYVLSDPRPTTWNDARDIARRRFPDAVESRLLVAKGSVDTTPLPVDASLTEEVFGFKFASFEEQVVSTVSHFLDLRIQQKAAAAHARGKAVRVQETVMQVRANA